MKLSTVPNCVGTLSCTNQLTGDDFQKIEKSIKVFLNERDLDSCCIIQRAGRDEAPGPGPLRGPSDCWRMRNPKCEAVIQSGNIYISFQALCVFICNFSTLLHHQRLNHTSLLQRASVVSETWAQRTASSLDGVNHDFTLNQMALNNLKSDVSLHGDKGMVTKAKEILLGKCVFSHLASLVELLQANNL